MAAWTPRGSPRVSRPATMISPSVGLSNAAMQRSRVVLPAPLGPTMARTAPASTVNDTPCSALAVG